MTSAKPSAIGGAAWKAADVYRLHPDVAARPAAPAPAIPAKNFRRPNLAMSAPVSSSTVILSLSKHLAFHCDVLRSALLPQ